MKSSGIRQGIATQVQCCEVREVEDLGIQRPQVVVTQVDHLQTESKDWSCCQGIVAQVQHLQMLQTPGEAAVVQATRGGWFLKRTTVHYSTWCDKSNHCYRPRLARKNGPLSILQRVIKLYKRLWLLPLQSLLVQLTPKTSWNT